MNPERKNKIRLHKKLIEIIQTNPSKYSEYTKPEIQRNIEKYGVFVNGFKVFNRLHWTLFEDRLDFSHWPVRAKGNFQEIQIILEKPDFLVIFKPKNLVVQPGAGHQQDNLVNWLEQRYPEQKKIDSLTRGLVHRLDKDTQGLLLIAKNQASLDFLQKQFRSRKVVKKYLAIVEGKFTKQVWIKNWQARSKQNPLRQSFFETELEAKNYDPKARFAESIFQPKIICPELNLSLIQIEIKTGRMHQIRLQAEALGFPLNQDKFYFKKTKKKLKPETVKELEPTSPVLKLSSTKFQTQQKKIFKNNGYSLLANSLSFEGLGIKQLSLFTLSIPTPPIPGSL